MPKSEKFQQLSSPWDRIFSIVTRTFVWALLIGIVYLLRPFFLLIFLTFVFAYIQSHGVEGLEHRIKNRVGRVITVFAIFLGVIVGTFYFLAPHVRDQVQDLNTNTEIYYARADASLYAFLDKNPMFLNMLPEEFRSNAKDTEGKSPGGPDKEPNTPPKEDQGAAETPVPGDSPRPPLVSRVVKALLGLGGDHDSPEDVFNVIKERAAGILGTTSSFLLAILFSFLIVLDLGTLTKGVKGLANTKLDFIYEEVADNIYQFGKRLGLAMEAQLFIAITNTILTGIGIWLLGIPNIVFLSTIVFFCSFIPVAGVFMSSAPICLLALQVGGENGVTLMLLAILMILVVHAIEAYILNPKIYGHHLRMNAVLVLIVLTIAGKLFGVWGLVLGLPVVNYVFGMAIRRDPEATEEKEEGVAAA